VRSEGSGARLVRQVQEKIEMKTILLLTAAACALSTGAYAQQKLSFTVQNNKFNVSQNCACLYHACRAPGQCRRRGR
jgi:hypothetical protein